MNVTQNATSEVQTVNQSTSPFDNEMVNAIRNGKLVQIPFNQLTPDEKRAAYVAVYHQGWW